MKTQSLASAHIRFSILFAALPLAVCALSALAVMRSYLVRGAREQMQNTLRETAQGINADFVSKACLTAMLVHDKPLMEKSLEYCAAQTASEKYKVSAGIDSMLERIFHATDLKGSVYLEFTPRVSNGLGTASIKRADSTSAARSETYVNRNYQALDIDKSEVLNIARTVMDQYPEYEYGSAFVHPIDMVFNQQSDSLPVCIMAVRPPRNMKYVTGVSAVVTAFASPPINAFIKGAAAYGDYRCVVGTGGTVLASSDREKGTPWQEVKERIERGHIITEQTIEATGWKICTAVPKRAITRGADAVMLALPAVLAGIAVFFALFNLSFFHRVLRPLGSAVDSIGRVAEGDFSARLPRYPYTEFNTLSGAFNSMTDRLDTLTKQIKVEQDERLATEIKALRFQLNPHFMCNTLNSMRMMAMIAGSDALTKMASALMVIMEDNLRGEGTFATLQHELSNLDSYVYIMQIRFGNKFDYFASVPDELQSLMVPSMLLQPIVENSILHGVRSWAVRGKITVSASIAKLDTGGALRLEVSDNGVGMGEEKMKALLGTETEDEVTIYDDRGNRRRGLNRVGVRSVRERIALLFGPPYSLDIASYPGEGTSVVMLIPIDNGSGDNDGIDDGKIQVV